MLAKLAAAFIVLSTISYAADVTAFIAPDSSFAALKEFLVDAGELKVATYTFTSPAIAELLHGNVTILVDASPVGGFPAESRAVLCRLSAKGISVNLYTGKLRFMHAKYILKDNAALITSENMGDDGFPVSPTHGNRGWGVIVKDRNVSEELSRIFMEDLVGSKPFVCDGNYSIKQEIMVGDYQTIFMPQRFDNVNVTLIVAPDAIPGLLGLINSAESRLLVEQFYIYRYFDRKTQSENPLLEALINAARRNVTVSVLLDSFYYNIESDDPTSNLYTNEYLNTVSRAEKLPLQSKLIELGSGLLKLHNKGMIADDSVLVSSINWNENSPVRNREVGVVVTGEAAGYFADVFNHDFYPENRITGGVTGLATVRNITGIVLVFILIAFFLMIRKRAEKYS